MILRAKQSASFNELVSRSHSLLGALQLADNLFEVRQLTGFPRLTMWIRAWFAHSRCSLCRLLPPCLEMCLPMGWDKSMLSSGCSATGALLRLGFGIQGLAQAACQGTRQRQSLSDEQPPLLSPQT